MSEFPFGHCSRHDRDAVDCIYCIHERLQAAEEEIAGLRQEVSDLRGALEPVEVVQENSQA